MLRPYFAQNGGTRSKGGAGAIARAGNMSNGKFIREDGACGPWPTAHSFVIGPAVLKHTLTKSRSTVGIMEIGVFVYHSFF